MKLVIFGADGFIGSSLVEKILSTTDWHISGIDINDMRVRKFLSDKHFSFVKGDITQENSWMRKQILSADAVLPFVAIATPMMYVKDPIRVYQSVFETNIKIIKQCVSYRKRIIFPSSSEVYGISSDDSFNEETTPLVQGPIHKERWIYACSKQLLDRVIWSYGRSGLKFSLFRPFNWIGGAQDDVNSEHARLIPKFLGNILRNEPMALVGGGEQRRSFTDIDDGVDALIRIIKNQDGRCNNKIFNIGNPQNNFSVKEVAETLIDVLGAHTEYRIFSKAAQMKVVSTEDFYGSSYQDMKQRVPDISAIRSSTGWKPKISLRTSIEKIVHFHLSSYFLGQAGKLVSQQN